MIVVALIIFSFLFLIFTPIKFELSFKNSNLEMFVSFLFFKIKINNKRGKIENKKHIKKNSILHYVTQIKQIVEKLKLFVPIFLFIAKKMRIYKVSFHLRISSEDAEKCAMQYSNAYSICKLIFDTLRVRKKKIRNLNFVISPDFMSYGTLCCGEFCVSISIVEIIYFLVYYTLGHVNRKMRE